MTTAAADARRLLDSVWPGGAEEPILPVDPVLIAKRLGLDVFHLDMDQSVAGMLVSHPGSDPQIFLNRSDATNRQRFTCAHEVGHFTQRVNSGESTFEFIDRRDVLSSNGSNESEIYANQFAAELLMPESSMRRYRKLSRVELAITFGVSADALNHRMTNLRLKS